ncbi:hypothetical protein K470DRAFT_260193 [Piedraia hortae CBS 480.64]|uniref:SAGA-associated factor 11 n=1 Tax=Piedraia hortae CBS 480.64 TaxID=1314780 RepID=A0A6A7BSW9_9PEZI|nr:hypothetical protein K470DRAFT_260193 [Piedraia hortae CBS 480.64]
MSDASSSRLQKIVCSVYNDVVQNTVHDILLQEHRAHKLLIDSIDPATQLPLCDKCSLPRVLDPPLAPKVCAAAVGSGLLASKETTVFCAKRPWCRTPGHDIFGNPFPRADVTGRNPTKKEREQQAKAAANIKKDGASDDGHNNSHSQGNTGPPSPNAHAASFNEGGTGPRKVEKGDKKPSKIEKLRKGEYVPYYTCPSCKRSLLIVRFAKHLDQCMGVSGAGRAASRFALARISASGSTPTGSRAGTPSLESRDGDPDNGPDQDGSAAVRKRVLKKGLTSKYKRSTKIKLTPAPQPKRAVEGSVVGSEGKREREVDDDDDEADTNDGSPKKRQRLNLERVGSMASFDTASVVEDNDDD